MEKINFYVFGEAGEYDNYNPYYVLSKKYISDILYLIAKDRPFHINKSNIIKKLNISEKEFNNAIDSLKQINALKETNNTYKLEFPIFLESDMNTLDCKFKQVGKIIGDKIVSLKNDIVKNIPIYTTITIERQLYHIICDNVFDGIAMDYFSKRNIFCTSKSQPNNRNYIIVGYENSEELEKYSDKLLCSSNNYKTDKYIFNSFGDCDGNRKDVYRFFRQVDKSLENTSSYNSLNTSYTKLNDSMNKQLMNKCGDLILKISKENNKYSDYIEDKSMLNLLKEFNYISIDIDKELINIKVPVFDKKYNHVIENIGEIILPAIEPIVIEFFKDIEANLNEITSISHKVDIKEISNELWHQVFGAINEYLVETNFVESPIFKEDEGRYLQSIYIK